MKFLWPGGGVVDKRFAGILTSPAHRGIPEGIVMGMSWAAENQKFTKGFSPLVFFPWLDTMKPYRENCLFVPPPDEVGNAYITLDLFEEWKGKFQGWPLAFVAQDGQEDLSFPDARDWQTLFIGGSTGWKLSEGAASCIRRAQQLGKRIHIGRVNWKDRYRHFRSMAGSEGFTCDGTRCRYDGREKTIKAWVEYMEMPNQPYLIEPGGYCPC